MTADELAEAEAWMRARMSETTYAVGGETDARDLWLVMAEYDRMREALARRNDPIETALEAQLGETEEKVRQLSANLAFQCDHLDTAIAARDEERRLNDILAHRANRNEPIVKAAIELVERFTAGLVEADQETDYLINALAAAVEGGGK